MKHVNISMMKPTNNNDDLNKKKSTKKTTKKTTKKNVAKKRVNKKTTNKRASSKSKKTTKQDNNTDAINDNMQIDEQTQDQMESLMHEIMLYKNSVSFVKKQKEEVNTQIHNQLREFLDSYVLMGYDAHNKERITLRFAPNQQSDDSLCELLKLAFFKMVQDGQSGQP